MLAAGSRGAPMEPGSWPFPRHRRIWTTGFVPPGRTRSGAWSRVSPRQTQCSVVRGLARRVHWDAIVGFVAAPMHWAILGHAGVLQYFDLQLLGLRREVLLYPNASYSGYHATHRSSPP